MTQEQLAANKITELSEKELNEVTGGIAIVPDKRTPFQKWADNLVHNIEKAL